MNYTSVTLEDLYNGNNYILYFDKRVICKNCYYEPGQCTSCQGRRYVDMEKNRTIFVHKGMEDGQKIYLRGEYSQQPYVGPGDIVVVFQQQPHRKFIREGRHLFMNHTISLTEAVCGFRMIIKHLDGRDIVLHHPPGKVIGNGTVKVIVNEGMPIFKKLHERGHLFIKFTVELPGKYFADAEKIEPYVEPGDILVFQQPHEKFIREGPHLFMNHTISLTEAVCRFRMIIKHLDWRDIVLHHPPGKVIGNGIGDEIYTVKELVNEGMPIFNTLFKERGNWYIKFAVELPGISFIDAEKIHKLFSLLHCRHPKC